ncbi:HNH endonuclease [Bacillus sp. LL01]|uniref:HNH endonuclease n=1 Tax=Bacillus sp. LL01 TaxID=1665556 RepID=UPI00064D2971|nr:HNH endonuclease [Bacillus sp. LL01]KMJ56446.1 HNH endonuclease [Bacillus sp. LL01]
MAHDYAKAFYTSKEWISCRIGFMQSKNYVCERCGGIATICHHKEYITPDNISDPTITLNWMNLEALCQTCHNLEHHRSNVCMEGLSFDSNGNLKKKEPPEKNF